MTSTFVTHVDLRIGLGVPIFAVDKNLARRLQVLPRTSPISPIRPSMPMVGVGLLRCEKLNS